MTSVESNAQEPDAVEPTPAGSDPAGSNSAGSGSAEQVTVPTPVPDIRVILIERAGCHLCADARKVVADVCVQAGEAWKVLDVDSSPELLAAYGELVPVVLVDGVPRGQWRLDPESVRSALRSA